MHIGECLTHACSCQICENEYSGNLNFKASSTKRTSIEKKLVKLEKINTLDMANFLASQKLIHTKIRTSKVKKDKNGETYIRIVTMCFDDSC